jgi:phosphomannomutase
MASVRATPPAQVGAVAVAEVHDFETDAQPANIVRLVLDDGTRLMIRPSGTEPKIKVYIDAVSTDGSLAERRTSANERADAAAEAMRALLS